MRLRPTELGLKGLLLLCALELAFLATAYSNLFFLLIVFCCVLGGLGLLWSVTNGRAVSVRLQEVPQAAAGEARDVGLFVSTGRRRSAFDITVTLVTPDGRVDLAHLPILRGEASIVASLPAQPRGVQTVDHLQVTSRYPFGLFRVSRSVAVNGEIVTHPRPLTPAERAARTSAGETDELLAASGARSNVVAGLRPFRTGDATADIHWKATARRALPVVKEREHDSGDMLEIVLDRRCEAEVFETTLALVTTALLQALAEQRPVQLRSQDHAVTLGGNRRSPKAVLHWLAAATALPGDAPPPPRGNAGALHLPRRRTPEAIDA